MDMKLEYENLVRLLQRVPKGSSTVIEKKGGRTYVKVVPYEQVLAQELLKEGYRQVVN